MTYTAQALWNIKRSIGYDLVPESIHSTADGTVALFHIATLEDPEGQMYEIEVRPASLSRYKALFGELIKETELPPDAIPSWELVEQRLDEEKEGI